MTKRILKINELLKREIGSILLREVDVPDEAFVTLTRVDTSPNLQQAKVYISVIPEEKSKETLRILGKQIFSIQQSLNKKLRMRPVPKIIWMAETMTGEAARIEEIMKEVQKNR